MTTEHVPASTHADEQVVRVYATSQEPDYDSPWQTRAPTRTTGSGVIIGPGRILTAAHVVANATFLQVQRVAEPDKAVARVEAICHDADLAVLAVDDAWFTEGVPAAEIGDLPALRDEVSVVGFPVGGDEISITRGVVSRIEVQDYTHSRRDLLAATVDAAINSGNSGGPVLRDGRVVGIAFQSLKDAENIGELVPPPVIRRFLDGIEQGRDPRVPALGIVCQKLESPLARAQLGLAPDDTGVMVQHVEAGSSAWGVLQARDALVAVDGQRIANNGTLAYRGRYRMHFSVVVSERYIGDTVTLDIVRAGERKTVTVTMGPYTTLVPLNQYDVRPTYFVFGGLVFQPLSRDFLSCWTEWWKEAPKEFLHEYQTGRRTEERREVVVMSRMLADQVNAGFDDFYNESIVLVNGVPPVDLKGFVAAIDAAEGVIELVTSRGGVIWFDLDETRAALPRILERYRIPADRSEDLVSGG